MILTATLTIINVTWLKNFKARLHRRFCRATQCHLKFKRNLSAQLSVNGYFEKVVLKRVTSRKIKENYIKILHLKFESFTEIHKEIVKLLDF